MLLKSLTHPDDGTVVSANQTPFTALLTRLPGAGDVFVRLAADGGAGRGEEGGALVLGAPLGLQHVDGDFVLAGEQQAREVDVVLLSQEAHYSAPMTLTCHPGQVPRSLGDN